MNLHNFGAVHKQCRQVQETQGIIKNSPEIFIFITYRSSIKKVLAEPYTDQSILDKAECMDLVKYDLAIVTMEISVSTYSEMVREEATSIGND